MINNAESELLHGLQEMNIKEIILMIWDTVTAKWHGLMEVIIRDSGNAEYNAAKVSYSSLIRVQSKDYSWTIYFKEALWLLRMDRKMMVWIIQRFN
jgi:hypothetical protein